MLYQDKNMESKKLGINSIILSVAVILMAIIFWRYVFMPFAVILTAAIAIITGIVGIITYRKDKDKTGLVTSIIGILISLPLMIYVMTIMGLLLMIFL